MNLQPNPPWIDKVLHANWAELERRVGTAMMPIHATSGPPRKTDPGYTEYGCGHYGCVFATGTKNVVCKVTSDESEIRFVNYCIDNKITFPEGIVTYYAIAKVSDKHWKRPVSVLWRQEAWDVGELTTSKLRGRHIDWKEQEEIDTHRLTASISTCGATVRESLGRKPAAILSSFKSHDQMDRARNIAGEFELTAPDPMMLDTMLQNLPGPERRAQVAISLYHLLSEILENDSATGYRIGQAFSYFFDHGILLADVHRNNIGKILPRSEDEGSDLYWAITDPGHAVFVGSTENV
jgi:hypothetical protein